MPQGLLISLEVIVNLELLVIRLQGPQLPEERQIFSRVLSIISSDPRWTVPGARHLLRVLSDHQHEGKVVHPQREVEQCGGVYEEDYVFHDIFDQVGRVC